MSGSALAVRDPHQLDARPGSALAPAGMDFTPAMIDTITRTVADGCTPDELAIFLHQCRRTGLDPLARQIYALKLQGKLSVQVSIDGFRLIAERTGLYAGQTPPQWCGPDGQWAEIWLRDEPPAAARVGVLRHGFQEPVYGVATYREFVRRNREGAPNSMWQQMPAHMLAKCGEALALRKAFPNELSGIYTDDEMGPARNPAPRQAHPAAQRAVQNAERPLPSGQGQRGRQQSLSAGASQPDPNSPDVVRAAEASFRADLSEKIPAAWDDDGLFDAVLAVLLGKAAPIAETDRAVWNASHWCGVRKRLLDADATVVAAAAIELVDGPAHPDPESEAGEATAAEFRRSAPLEYDPNEDPFLDE